MTDLEKLRQRVNEYLDSLPFYERWWITIQVFFNQLWYWHIGSLLWRWFKIDVYGDDDD